MLSYDNSLTFPSIYCTKYSDEGAVWTLIRYQISYHLIKVYNLIAIFCVVQPVRIFIDTFFNRFVYLRNIAKPALIWDHCSKEWTIVQLQNMTTLCRDHHDLGLLKYLFIFRIETDNFGLSILFRINI